MAARDFQKKPLYRKVNTKARGVHHNSGADYRHSRNTKAEKDNTSPRGKMKQGVQRGLDYTPLYRFLISKVGQLFAEVHSEAVGRLDHEDPIFHIVARDAADASAVVRIGESSHYSGLFIDDSGNLQLVDPNVKISQLWPTCSCCTHTFNGEVFTNPFDETRRFPTRQT